MRDIQPILQELKVRLQGLYDDRLKGLYLFGSYARGEAQDDSDVDVAVVLDDYEYASDVIEETAAVVSALSLEHNCLLSLIPVRQAAWPGKDDSLLTNIRREGVVVP